MEINMEQRRKEKCQCQFWLPRKNRLCAAASLPGLLYCGNHKPSTSGARVPCPMDPSHTILQEDLESHLRKCPALKQLHMLQQEKYYCKGINSGSDREEDHVNFKRKQLGNTDKADGKISFQSKVVETREVWSENEHWTSCMKRKALYSMSHNDLKEFINKIMNAYDLHCHEGNEDSFQKPYACSKWMNLELDRRIPFKEKHALQQASLLGNLEAFGLIRSSNTNLSLNVKTDDVEIRMEGALNDHAIVEFGAGRGYLTHMLADCYGIEKAVLIERKSYKFKADRTLREKQTLSLERLRIDIEDLDLKGVKSLRQCEYIAVSKHLCGPATDLALRCCLFGCKPLEEETVIRQVQQKPEGCTDPCLYGIGVATCCHHLCQWNPYVNKTFFKELGFSREEFNMLTWMTSWAVEGATHGCNNQASARLHVSIDNSQSPNDENSLAMDDITRLLEPAERSLLGLKCKLLIDIGRVQFLKQIGMDAKLVAYVPASISPENKLILARWATRHEFSTKQ